MINVAVLASSLMTRARLESLVAARPGLQIAAVGVEADVLLVDPGGRRLEAVLATLPPAARMPPVVVLADDSSPSSARLLRAGVRAILPRDASALEIGAGVEAVSAGLVVLHPSTMPGAAAAASSTRRARGETRVEALTRRELEVLGMMAEGLGNRAIARQLGI